MLKAFAFTLSSMLLVHCSAFADPSAGKILETNMWENMKHQNWTAVEDSIAPNFQSVHTFGSLNRDQEIELIKKLYLGTYRITDLKVTEGPDSYIVTYIIAVKEKIDNELLPAAPTARMSIWQKIDGKWQWVAHASLNPIPASKEKKVADASTDTSKKPKDQTSSTKKSDDK